MKGLRGIRAKTVKEGTLIATVDIGLRTNTGYCTTLDGRDTKAFRFDNTKEGFERFWCMIMASKNRFGCDEVVVGYESTGPYAEPLVHYLAPKQVKIVQVNPMHTKKVKEVNDNSPLKTDDKDPRVIADIIRLGRALTIVVPEGDAADLRRLNNARERHVGEQTARSYLSSNEPDPSRKQLVFDPFVALDRGASIMAGFEKNFAPPILEDLNDLLAELNYFGRSESWIRAGLAQEGSKIVWNCIPSEGVSAPGKEMVRVACLLPPEEYESRSVRFPKRDWLNALCLTTKELLDEGWSDPPALQWVDYLRPAPQTAPVRRRTADTAGTQFRSAKYALSSKVLPRVQETVPFAERIRGHLMGIHKRIKNGDPALASPLFSGKNREGKPL